MLKRIIMWWHIWRLRRAPLKQVHDVVRNDPSWIANWSDDGKEVVYIPKSKATDEQKEVAIPPLQLAKWQRGIEKKCKQSN